MPCFFGTFFDTSNTVSIHVGKGTKRAEGPELLCPIYPNLKLTILRYYSGRSRDRSLSPGRIHRAWHRFWHPFHHHHHHHYDDHRPPSPPQQPPPYELPPQCPPPKYSTPVGILTLQVRDRTTDDPHPYNPHGRNFTITVTPETRPCDIIYSLAPPRSRCTVLVCSTFQPAYVMPKDVSLPGIANMGCWLEVVDR